MLFNSLTYILFFTAVCFLYFLLPHRFRWLLLLAASYIFYAWWSISYLAILFASTAIVYAAALAMRVYKEYRGRILALGVFMNLAILLAFKYSGFINSNLRMLSGYVNIPYPAGDLKILMPIGISFYIFKSISYIIDVYRNKIEPERHFGIFALYVSFFPQLLAGPIERSTMLLPRLKNEFSYDYDRIADGLKLAAWGFFKKLVIADRLCLYVDRVYADPGPLQGIPVLLAAYFFTIQIYCDFSGYSDIAIGSAKILGYEGMENFRRPYFSKTMGEFWNRWHISLSTWFRDYLYIPLGGNRVSTARRYFNIMTVFLLSGLWHGANWTFVAWGGIHGIFLVTGYATLKARSRIKNRIPAIIGMGINGTVLTIFNSAASACSIIITFNLAAFAWIFFRAETFAKAMIIIRNIFKWDMSNMLMGFSPREFIIMTISLVMLFIFDAIQEHNNSLHPFTQKRAFARWVLYYAVILAIVFFGVLEQSKFIYFNF
jgi:alginate O-acetyltransferase complex protein AlgI